jgi:hypothetical protein
LPLALRSRSKHGVAMRARAVLFWLLPTLLVSCAAERPPREPLPSPLAAPPPLLPPLTPPAAPTYSGIDRATVNRAAVRLNLPLFWTNDLDKDGAVDPTEVASLLFYPTEGHWVEAGAFTPAFADAWSKIQKEANLAPPSDPREALVVRDLDQGLATLVATDLRTAPYEDGALSRHLLKAAHLIDALYAMQIGAEALASQVPADAASQSLFRRNWGPRCVGPLTENDPACSAIPGAPKAVCDAYPGPMQRKVGFCEDLEKLPNAKELLSPFVVVRAGAKGTLAPLSFALAYRGLMTAIAEELRAAATEVTSSNEAALRAYLLAAAESFTTNDWLGADEAWSKMNALNSKWYLRIGPDEVYWDPCNQKAGFHMTFARINADSLAWQNKLVPVQQEMERTIAAHIGAPYVMRAVTFHLPDFIDIVWNAGDDRNAMGATIGQSLPNWGPVAAQGRGRTVAMSNLYQDVDSRAIRRKQAESLLSRESMKGYVDSAAPGLLSTILHEATHNLGPSHEYRFGGKTDAQAFGGQMSTMLEELKAQSGALYFIDFARIHGIIGAEEANETYANCVVWAFGHIGRGMYDAARKRKPYSQLAAIQVGFLMDEGALSFDPNEPAANGTDKGAFTIHYDRFPGAAEKLIVAVGRVKAKNDRAAAEAMTKRYVDGDRVPQSLIAERELRYPRQSFVYAVEM